VDFLRRFFPNQIAIVQQSLKELPRDELEYLANELARLSNSTSQPNLLATAIDLRDMAHLRRNSKLFAAYIADLIYNTGSFALVDSKEPAFVDTKGRVCKQADFSSPWFLHWMGQLQVMPFLHRKLWEDAYVIQCLWERGCLAPEKRGLGFAVGMEALPSFFASCGVSITGTDLSPEDERSHDWRLTHQHASNIESLWKPYLIGREPFLERCAFKFVDMNNIPAELDGEFDFCWSVCAFEHLGTLDNGLEFVRKAMRTLRPGGVAVHTTEYNISDGETIDNWPTVLYQKRHFAALGERLAAEGMKLVEIDFDIGSEFFDSYVDVPPYPHDPNFGLGARNPPHLKLSVDGFAATSIAILVEKPAEQNNLAD
jgi:SAM-dependent methyltransferase